MILQPETYLIRTKQLVNEVKGIAAGLVMVKKIHWGTRTPGFFTDASTRLVNIAASAQVHTDHPLLILVGSH